MKSFLEVSDEMRIHSQHGEDGVIESITCLLGRSVPKTFVEFGAHVSECNTLSLRSRGWAGIIVDRCGGEGIIEARVSLKNVNSILREHFSERTLGVVSIDLDGNDYWIIRAIQDIDPLIAVVEYNAAFDSKVKLATPYREPREWKGGWDYSASLNGSGRNRSQFLERSATLRPDGCAASVRERGCKILQW